MLKIIENGKETGYIQVFQWHKTSVQRPTRFDFYKCGLGAVVIDLAFAPSDCFANDVIFAKNVGMIDLYGHRMNTYRMMK